jgi:DNA end-binding protein Ku
MAIGRPYWKGHLKLSLVTCPVALFPASSQSGRTRFHQINRKTGNRLRQMMVDSETGKPVDKDNKGRGYEVSKGKYVEIAPEELDAVEAESTRTIDIETFVPEEEIDKRYYERPYYIVPDDKSGEEAFGVIRDAMKDKGRVALGRIVFANREHIMAIEPWDKGMLGTTLRYDHEVREAKDVFSSIGNSRVPKEMIELATHILEKKAGHFDPKKFEDTYELALRKLVKKKAAGGVIERAEPTDDTSNVIDLMAALKQSLGSSVRKPTRARAASNKSAHRKRSKAR